MPNNVNIFDKFGIKEVANVYFEALADENGTGVHAGDVVLFLDTLKVSSIETTAEQVDARGGWGNPKLITWDFGKEITLTLTDALLSLESARMLLGGKIRNSKNMSADNEYVEVRYNASITATAGAFTLENAENPSTREKYATGDTDVSTNTKAENKVIRFINLTKGTRGFKVNDGYYANYEVTDNTPQGVGESIAADIAVGDNIRAFWVIEKKADSQGNEAVEIVISPDVFPGTYRIVGDTFMRSQKDGKDYPFQFVIGKAKVASEVSISMEAEGDPSVFDMTINVLKADDGNMMSLVRYSESTDDGTQEDPGEETP